MQSYRYHFVNFEKTGIIRSCQCGSQNMLFVESCPDEENSLFHIQCSDCGSKSKKCNTSNDAYKAWNTKCTKPIVGFDDMRSVVRLLELYFSKQNYPEWAKQLLEQLKDKYY